MKSASHSPFNGLRRCGWLCGVLVLVLSAPAVLAQTNLALKKPAAQSSTWSYAFPAASCVDGIKGTVCATGLDTNPWWQVDLQGNYALSEIVVNNRTDCCSERSRTLTALLSFDGKNWSRIYTHDGSDFKTLRINAGGRTARYVRLQQTSTDYMNLEEVEVYGSPGATQPPPQPPPPGEDRLGTEWSMTEAGITGRWVRRGTSDTWDATWANGAAAILTISITGDKVRINRKDLSGGITAIYEGTLASDGTMQGTETVTSPSQFSQKWQGRIVKGFQAPPPPTGAAIRYRVENLVYNMPDIYTNPRNLHDFVVDFTNCTVRNLSKESDEGQVSIKVLVCRDKRRLTFTASRGGATVEYDWVFRDNGKIVAGVWRQGAGFGPCVGAIFDINSGWDVR
jgi:hypothetical protein